MSLINEALKRAKQTQQDNPPTTPPLEFLPEEPNQHTPRRTTLLIVSLSLVVVMILGLAGTLIWFVLQADSARLPVAARAADAPLASPQPAGPVAPAPTTAEPSEHSDESNTNRVPAGAVVVEVITPPAVKLQGIFFNPSNPSAVVNGKTVYLGEHVNGFRVIGISPVAVTLVSATDTNVLSLSGQ